MNSFSLQATSFFDCSAPSPKKERLILALKMKKDLSEIELLVGPTKKEMGERKRCTKTDSSKGKAFSLYI